ncbi:MAG TPA: N-acetylglucosamine-6-phosphate deacetylase [Ktedonobacterales bacterium]|nr:N-acetylglucosamine-6-phosphate deacetylase [Ktedonobacterales bacterium]
MRLTLRGAHLIDATHDLPASDLTVADGRIVAVGPMAGPSDGHLARDGRAHETRAREGGVVVDVADMLLLPGFIDVHTHGGGGFNLHTAEAAEIQAYARWAPQTGVTGFLIGVVGTPDALPEAQLRAAVAAIEECDTGARPLGIHLEGPYINSVRRGAHMTSWLRMPDLAEAEHILALTRGHLRLVTLAPELPGAPALIRCLVAAGVTVSIGHTDATYEETLAAIALGATHATHCCNAMRPLLHRDPGPLGALAQAAAVAGELIADGVHVHPAVMQVVVRTLGSERTIVITDAMAAAGMPDGPFEFAGQPAHIKQGAARLADGTITGSVLTMDQALRNMLTMTDVALPAAVGMLTRNPARAAQVAAHKGLLRVGYDADLVLCDASLIPQATFCGGTLAFATAQWRERLESALASGAV